MLEIKQFDGINKKLFSKELLRGEPQILRQAVPELRGTDYKSLVTFSFEPGFRKIQQSPAWGSEAALWLTWEQRFSNINGSKTMRHMHNMLRVAWSSLSLLCIFFIFGHTVCTFVETASIGFRVGVSFLSSPPTSEGQRCKETHCQLLWCAAGWSTSLFSLK